MLWRADGESRTSPRRFKVLRVFFLSHRFSFLLLSLVYRDIGGSDPERMAAPRVAEYVQELFKNSPVKVRIDPRILGEVEAK